MKKRIELDLEKPEYTMAVGKALASRVRLDIMKTLLIEPASISELADQLGLPLSSCALHVRVLEQAGIIRITEKPGLRGSQKLCTLDFDDMYFNPHIREKRAPKTRMAKYAMPIGCYFDCDVCEPCGIASEKKYLGIEDSESAFYSAERMDAQLIWFLTGYLEYRFPTHLLRAGALREVKFSFEVCSEAPGHHMDWPSDITVWLNGREVAELYSPSDFGDRRGTYTPSWWSDNSSQYGELHSVSVNDRGCFADNLRTSGETIDSLGLAREQYVSFKIGVKRDAVHTGGLNLFGEKFGDYRQNIVMSAKYGM